MQKIRKVVVADKSLSTYGHNVKIISEHGKVTLKDPVHTEEERKTSKPKPWKGPVLILKGYDVLTAADGQEGVERFRGRAALASSSDYGPCDA